MDMGISFIINSVLLGVGLAMDAFSVSMADGLANPKMCRREMGRIAGCFAFFQWLMPMLGWVLVHTIVLYFQAFQKLIPWIALILLCYIGGTMLLEGLRNPQGEEINVDALESKLPPQKLAMQGIATSIDALSVGFTIAEYHVEEALMATLIIAAVTFAICITGLHIGRAAGTKLSGKAAILGGVILIGIGIEIFVSNLFF